MLIAAVNQSTLMSNADAQTMCAAIAQQIKLDLAPYWEKVPPAIIFYADPKQVPANAHDIAFVDNTDQKGVLGWHTEDPSGNIHGIVAVKPSLDAGAAILTGDWSVSSVFGHEAGEMFINPSIQGWESDGRKKLYAREVGDPAEGPTYVVNGVSVPNLVLPAWFDPQAPKGSKFDIMGLMTAPFEMLKTGYVVYMTAGKVHQKFGEEMPDWRKETKKAEFSRTHRLTVQTSE